LGGIGEESGGEGRHEWRNADQLSAVSNHRTFRSGAIYRAMNCAATMYALGYEGIHVLTDEHYVINGDPTGIKKRQTLRSAVIGTH
jgi:hypothetical protein